ncbi:hypothetical protein AJ78_00908 [Emergomyces pasteurianus Ep9510]|uniref:Ketoreductase domain-containing protein n=1 Tax=Emergomyces pasteurianus Ep9510 TaxID=1447872 RepID=A0A1J9PT89_9EURO|nr:hypothetical protein AJ78_00908 [Emergomyces pasteurianus Ep9510]
MDSTPLKGKFAIVTGGSRGLGRAIAVELAKRGASILLTFASSAVGAEKTATDITAAGGKAQVVAANGHDAQKAVDAIIAKALELSLDGIDIVVNNAADGSDQTLEDVDTAIFDRVMHTNVLFPMLLVKACRPHLRRGARVVNISSTSARRGMPSSICYAASKAALENLTRSLAWELGRSLDATVNAVNPGPIATEMWHSTTISDVDFLEVEEYVKKQTPAGHRIAMVDDVSAVVAFLCDPSARWISGVVTCANGGLVST